jgi:hypothetical protein
MYSYSDKYAGAPIILHTSGRHKYHSLHVIERPELPNHAKLDQVIVHSHDKQDQLRGDLLAVVDSQQAYLEVLILPL